jgi:hypothetical protein
MKRLLACLLLAAVTGPALAQDLPETIKLSVRANGAPIPALKYRLLPEAHEMKTGNAALDYYRGFSPEWWGAIQRQPAKYWEDMFKYSALPLEELRKTDVSQYPIRGGMMKQLDRAARRDYCDWELGPRVAEEGVGTLIPDVQGMRNYANLLALRTRVEMAGGNVEKALYALQTGLRMAKHVGEGHTLINVLVGVACGQIILQQLETLIQLDNAPNLYWALTELPRPYFDLTQPLNGERLMVDAEYSGLRSLEKGPMTLEEVQKLLDTLSERSIFWKSVDRKQLTTDVIAQFPRARAELIRSGRPMAEVDKMPALQVVLLWSRMEVERMRHDMAKWMALPFAEGRDGLKRAIAAANAAKEQQRSMELVHELISGYDKVHLAALRMDRRIALLRGVEALKLQVADAGHWPASLDEVKSAPVPLDPMVGKPFEYSVSGETVILVAPLYGTVRGNGWRYEITLKK